MPGEPGGELAILAAAVAKRAAWTLLRGFGRESVDLSRRGGTGPIAFFRR
jgi:hypothetical protein